MDITNVIKIFADQNRLRILNILKNNELCVGEIQTLLNLKQSNVSRHLEKLYFLDIIKKQKKAQWVYYSLNDDFILKYNFIENLIFNDLENYKIYQSDINKLNMYINSKMNCKNLRNCGFDFNKLNIN